MMKTIRELISVALAFLCATSLAFSQELNVLVIGSTHSFSEGGESGVVHEKPFNPTAIATYLQGILVQDAAITDTVNVVFEDIYKTKFLTVNYSGSQVYDFTSRCYSLAQHYMWPDGKATRLANPATYRAVFARRKDYQTAGLNYTVCFTADPTRWTTVGTPPVRLSGNNTDPVETVSIDFPASVPLEVGGSGIPEFFRVVISSNQ